jgi:hypothetical protein
MITVDIKGQSVEIPTRWEDVKFKHYCEILKGETTEAKAIAMFTDIPYETLKNATVFGLEDMVIALSFLKKPVVIPEEVDKIGPYALISRQNIKFESLALFEDMKSVAMKADPKNIHDFTSRYGDYVAMYLQKVRDSEYSFEKAKAMRREIDELPAVEVISLGAFFFIKLGILLSGTKPNSLPTSPSPKKSKLATKSSRKHSVRTARSRKRR